jgi:hypothetical protein
MDVQSNNFIGLAEIAIEQGTIPRRSVKGRAWRTVGAWWQ